LDILICHLVRVHITNAAIIPGIHPHIVSKVTIKIDPQPLSSTERGGSIIHNIALAQPIVNPSVYEI
jgi:hypothetical protein